MPRDVFVVIDDLANGLAELRRMLAPLASLAGDRATASKGARRTGSGKATRRGRRPPRPSTRRGRPVSPAVRASRKLQGQYLAAVRRLTKAQRVQVKRLLVKDGKEAAIKAAKSMQKAA